MKQAFILLSTLFISTFGISQATKKAPAKAPSKTVAPSTVLPSRPAVPTKTVGKPVISTDGGHIIAITLSLNHI